VLKENKQETKMMKIAYENELRNLQSWINKEL